MLQAKKKSAQEREREEPIKTPPSITRGPNGEVIVKLDRRHTQSRIGLKTELTRSETICPEMARSYEHLPGRPWNVIYCARTCGRNIAVRLSPEIGRGWERTYRMGSPSESSNRAWFPFERVDVGNRLTSAQADVEAAQASVDASRAEYERLKGLNANKNVSDRAVQETEARASKAIKHGLRPRERTSPS